MTVHFPSPRLNVGCEREDAPFLLDFQFHLLSIVDHRGSGVKGKEVLKEGGLANLLIPNNHELGAMEGHRGFLEVKDVLDDLVGWFLPHFDWKGGQGGRILGEKFEHESS